MTISPEAKEAGRDWAIPAIEFQKVADKLTAPLQKEIEQLKLELEELQRNTIGSCSICHHKAWKLRPDEVEECQVCRLRGEVRKAHNEGWRDYDSSSDWNSYYDDSRAKRVVEGKE